VAGSLSRKPLIVLLVHSDAITFDILQLLTLMRQKSMSNSGLSLEDAQKQLDLVVRLVPGWLIEVNTPCLGLASLGKPGSISVRLDRRLSWVAARAKLLAAAEQSKHDRAHVKAACEQEAVLEQQEAVAEAAKVTAAAVAAQPDAAAEGETDGEAYHAGEVVVAVLSADADLGMPSFTLGWGAGSSRGPSRATRSSSTQSRPVEGGAKEPVFSVGEKRLRCSNVPQQHKVSAAAADLLGVGGTGPASSGAGSLLSCLAFTGPRKPR
jgi:hypothetical protein